MTKQMKHKEAIDRFNYALKIDATNPDTYVAKGCALANIVIVMLNRKTTKKASNN